MLAGTAFYLSGKCHSFSGGSRQVHKVASFCKAIGRHDCTAQAIIRSQRLPIPLGGALGRQRDRISVGAPFSHALRPWFLHRHGGGHFSPCAPCVDRRTDAMFYTKVYTGSMTGVGLFLAGARSSAGRLWARWPLQPAVSRGMRSCPAGGIGSWRKSASSCVRLLASPSVAFLADCKPFILIVPSGDCGHSPQLCNRR